MATSAAKKITTSQIENFQSNLDDALKTIEEVLANKAHTHDDLVEALRTVELAFSTGNKELFEYLQLGEVALVRDSVDQILANPTTKQLTEKNRDQIKNALRGIAKEDAKKLRGTLKKIKGEEKMHLVSGSEPTEEEKRKLFDNKISLYRSMQNNVDMHVGYSTIIGTIRKMAKGRNRCL